MKTTIELPDPLFRQAKIFAARRGTTLRELVVAGLQQVTASRDSAGAGTAPHLTPEEAAVATFGAHGLPVLKRPARAKRRKITRALVDRLRDELAL
ncbi:MAG: hypothetical protein EXS38_12325 [Opitutus sp.]|nr:hypothetical protein [Opitutus sp.]